MIDTISGFLNEYEKEQATIDARKYYEDLLTTGINSARQQYQASTQKAAEQASYDISGAYANYLKQQRNAMSQGRLESGYKEELGDVLQQQYQNAYSQARTAQVQNIASAQTAYNENVAALQQTEEQAQTAITKSLTERAQRASQFQELVWRQYGITDPEKQLTADIYDKKQGLYPVYDKDDTTGDYTLTDFGKDWVQRAMLQGVENDKGKVVKFEDWLREEDEKAYETYKTYYGEIIKDVGDLEYEQDEKGNYLLPAYKETAGKDTRLKTEGYIESISKPKDSFELKGSDYGLIDFGDKGKDKIQPAVVKMQDYGHDLGLSETEVASTVKNYITNNIDSIINDSLKNYDSNTKAGGIVKDALLKKAKACSNYNDILDVLDEFAKQIQSATGQRDKSGVVRLYNALLDELEKDAKTKHRGA